MTQEARSNDSPSLLSQLHQISPDLRSICVILFISGAGLSVVGVLGDIYGWWESVQFATNLIAGAAGASFGIPFAILVLGALNARNIEQKAVASTTNLTIESLRRFREAARPILAIDAAELSGWPMSVNLAFDGLAPRSEYLIDELSHYSDQPFDDNTMHEVFDIMDSVLSVLQPLRDKFRSLVPASEEEVEIWWNGVLSAWKFLEGHVQARVHSESLPWFDISESARITWLMYDVGHPLRYMYEFQYEVVEASMRGLYDRTTDDKTVARYFAPFVDLGTERKLANRAVSSFIARREALAASCDAVQGLIDKLAAGDGPSQRRHPSGAREQREPGGR